MKRSLSFFCTVSLVALFLLVAGCSDKKAVIDQNIAIADHNWTYANRLLFSVNVDDEKAAYNAYMNLRVTSDYRYSNMFVLISETGPDKKTVVKRYELKLASKDGEWLGEGTGNLYSYQLIFLNNYKFKEKGIYQFHIEQNMRDNPLREVSDVGLRVEKTP